jgi:hypothetical protein
MILLVSSMCGSNEFLKNFNKILPQQRTSTKHHYLGYNSAFNGNRWMQSSLPVHTVKAHVRSTALTIHSTSWTGVVSYMPKSLYCSGKHCCTCWTHRLVWIALEKKKNLALVWDLTMIHWPCSHRPVLHKYIYTTCLYSERKPHSQFLCLCDIH